MWISSSSARGGTPPYLSPYFAAKAAMDSLAVSYAGELARWGIETSIIVPGAFTKGTNHFAHSGAPADADAASVAEAVVRVIDAPFGKRPFRVHIDPSQDGAEIVNAVADRVRADLLWRIGLQDLPHPRMTAVS